jgi:DNA polymerase III delta prime subunit
MQTSCLNCSDIVATLNKIESDPPHLFFSGTYGAGKTTLATDFLKHYFTSRGVKFEDPNWCLQIRSDQDRGIHRIRETITEFVRRLSVKPGVYRWIFIDDADSLPVLSQQALRRPM